MWRKWMPAASEDQTGDVIKGIAGSAGTITAPARVLGGPQDFGQMQPGDVLVASITTPAWTSLFAMASGSSPTSGARSATARSWRASTVFRRCSVPPSRPGGFSSGQLIRVDGDAGTVSLLDGTEQSRDRTRSTEQLAASHHHRCDRRRCRCRWTNRVAGATPQVTQAELSL